MKFSSLCAVTHDKTCHLNDPNPEQNICDTTPIILESGTTLGCLERGEVFLTFFQRGMGLFWSNLISKNCKR